jgi:hypothetical protein
VNVADAFQSHLQCAGEAALDHVFDKEKQMRTKEEYYNLVLQNRKIVSDPDNRNCSCPKAKCEWHGKCTECVTMHRYYKDHVPNCFQPFIADKIRAVAQIAELVAVEKEKTPPEYWDYVRARDNESTK